ncbi:MAG: hypothetical protein COB51_13610 [Moraxellaceae bacterium]|nr:MAG: hypothetical protein COB51_13610 [Moraxellaceae bacterium]
MQQKMVRALACEYAHGAIDTEDYRRERKQLIDEFIELNAGLSNKSFSAQFIGQKLEMLKVNSKVKPTIVLVVSILALLLLAFAQSPFIDK